MEIIHDFPPNFDEIEKVFGSIPITVVFTYGSKIYAPGHGDISENLMVHEQIHEAQQAEAGGPESWWKRYLEDPIFRLDQEVEAYHAQYRHYARIERDRNKRIRFLSQISIDLSSTIYGGIVGYRQAMQMIKRGRDK
jgi:hypothetical protein